MEGTNTTSKWSYQWETECAHLVLGRGQLTALELDLAVPGETALSGVSRWIADMPDQNPHLLLIFSVCVSFHRYSVFVQVQLAIGQKDPSSSSSPRGGKVIHPLWWDIQVWIPVENAFPKLDEAWCSQQHSTLTHGKTQHSVCLLRLPYL